MKLLAPPLPQFNLKTGGLLVTQEPQWVVTVLGSCVAVTMFNARLHLAAICHAALPQLPHHGREAMDSATRLRYLSHVIPAMTHEFASRGLRPAEVEVKLFGGGNVLKIGRHRPAGTDSIGEANIAMARHLLTAARYHITALQVGDARGCKLMFNTHSGEVFYKPLSQRMVTA